jgi:hypothetical protein
MQATTSYREHHYHDAEGEYSLDKKLVYLAQLMGLELTSQGTGMLLVYDHST